MICPSCGAQDDCKPAVELRGSSSLLVYLAGVLLAVLFLNFKLVMPAVSLTKSAFAKMVMQVVQEKIIDFDKLLYGYLRKLNVNGAA